MMYEAEFRDRLGDAFKALRKQGFFARQNWQCCQSCGCAAIPDDKGKKYVFYHAQDNARLKHRSANYGTYLTFGETAAEGRQIVAAVKTAGLDVDWDGTTDRRIFVRPAKNPDVEYTEQLETLLGRA